MELRVWRKSQGLRLQQVAPIFGVSIATVSLLERGQTNVSQETIARIEGATGGSVLGADLDAAWRAENSETFSHHRAAGRSAMAAFRKTAKKPR